MSVTFGGQELPGLVLRGYRPEDPELRVERFHPPGVHGELEIPNGLRGRLILVPMLVTDAAFSTYKSLADYLRELEVRKSEAAEATLIIPVPGDENEVFEHCRFDGFKISPDGILPASGTLSAGSYFCEGLYIFRQNAAVT